MYTGRISDAPFGPPAVSRYGVKVLNVHSVISSVLVRMCPRMLGITTSRSCCQVLAPAIRELSSCDGGTAPSAEENSSMENAVPTQMLKMMMLAIGYSISQAVPRSEERRVGKEGRTGR